MFTAHVRSISCLRVRIAVEVVRTRFSRSEKLKVWWIARLNLENSPTWVSNREKTTCPTSTVLAYAHSSPLWAIQTKTCRKSEVAMETFWMYPELVEYRCVVLCTQQLQVGFSNIAKLPMWLSYIWTVTWTPSFLKTTMIRSNTVTAHNTSIADVQSKFIDMDTAPLTAVSE